MTPAQKLAALNHASLFARAVLTSKSRLDRQMITPRMLNAQVAAAEKRFLERLEKTLCSTAVPTAVPAEKTTGCLPPT